MVVVMLRGAVDGLNVVVPYHESNYFASRPNIGLGLPHSDDGVLDLDGFFGLHPALQPIMPLWQNKSLAFIHASGSPATTRSHFEAQDIMETASIDHSTGRGWMNNLIQLLPDTGSASRALSISNILPRIFMGSASVMSVSTGLKPAGGPIVDNSNLTNAFEPLYRNNPALSQAFQEGKAGHDAVMNDLQKEMGTSSQSAPYADGFVVLADKLSGMIREDPNIQLAFLDVGGWDTHVNQGNAKGPLANNLARLGEGLTALANGLGPSYQDTVILVMSEFGRTVAENGNRGTDHGHGNVIWLLGGGVKGGKVWGRWPGLSPQQLYEQRDLAITTDFRSVIGTLLNGHFGLSKAQIAQVIESYQPDGSLTGIV